MKQNSYALGSKWFPQITLGLCFWRISIIWQEIDLSGSCVAISSPCHAIILLQKHPLLVCFSGLVASCTINILTTSRSFWRKRKTNERNFSLSLRLPDASKYTYTVKWENILKQHFRHQGKSTLFVCCHRVQYLDVNIVRLTKWWMFSSNTFASSSYPKKLLCSKWI